MSGPMNVYGYCPQCGEPGESRLRSLNGNDICIMGHSYPSSDALKDRPISNQSDQDDRAKQINGLHLDAEIAKLVRTIFNAAHFEVETINEAILMKLFELKGTPINYVKNCRDIERDFNYFLEDIKLTR